MFDQKIEKSKVFDQTNKLVDQKQIDLLKTIILYAFIFDNVNKSLSSCLRHNVLINNFIWANAIYLFNIAGSFRLFSSLIAHGSLR